MSYYQIILFRFFYIFLFSFSSHSMKLDELSQINLDNFDPHLMELAWKKHGTFELTGPSIDALREVASPALLKSKQILALPIDDLEAVASVAPYFFHGFDNVKQKTINKNDIVRNQIAYHLRPYFDQSCVRVPEFINIDELHIYYSQAREILLRLYDLIVENFSIDNPSDFSQDRFSSLSVRRYFETPENSFGTTGIPAHSDYGILTLVTSDKPGLQVYDAESYLWLDANHGEELRFYVNIGDWLLFQSKRDDFTLGVHMVPHTREERHSMAMFLNAPYDEILETPSGNSASFKEYLQSDKSAYLKK